MLNEALIVGDDLTLRLLEEALVEASDQVFLDIVLDPEDHHMLAKLGPFIGTWGQDRIDIFGLGWVLFPVGEFVEIC